jgi:hypothetical protein
MERLTIHAARTPSAETTPRRQCSAPEEYVTDRLGGPARVELNGRTYVMHLPPEAD